MEWYCTVRVRCGTTSTSTDYGRTDVGPAYEKDSPNESGSRGYLTDCKPQKKFPGFHWFPLVSQFLETENPETGKPGRHHEAHWKYGHIDRLSCFWETRHGFPSLLVSRFLLVSFGFLSFIVSFEINIITPFEGVTLEIGRDVLEIARCASYSVSACRREESHTAVIACPAVRFCLAVLTHRIGSPTTVTSKAQPITISSIAGSYVYIVVQDLHPVVFGEWQLPQQDFELWVADVTISGSYTI
ncbi:hypothetical protein F5148DRAFT_1145922 [Russula earlei]|uniref:Uncharacterized protein n=1 Tax=Russula earlei TaxID=71964 RepID=A0ACC0UPG8_9AGAM|nr:hypothetical protein F5148DRAFT_1145922 [Russula earlei]